ncbi:MAG: hypothetical protein ACJ75R_04670 [Solirubrobacterales bacterium]
MRRSSRQSTRRLRVAVDRLPQHTKEAMLRGISSNRIIVGAYVDPRSGGVCPMLAAHRNGGRTSVASFARAWDEYTGAKRPRRATRREVSTLRALLEQSLDVDQLIDRTPIAELAAQIRAEREAYRCATAAPAEPTEPIAPPDPDDQITIRRRRPAGKDLLAALESELETTNPAP